MLKGLQDNFKKGIEKIKWFSSLISERLKIEVAVIRLLYKSEEMAKKKHGLMQAIGQRVIELKGHSDKNIFKDSVIVEATAEIEKLDKNIDELKQKAAEISRVTG
jgi:hypothetical protein